MTQSSNDRTCAQIFPSILIHFWWIKRTHTNRHINNIYMHACMHIMRTYIHTYLHTYRHTYIHTFISLYLNIIIYTFSYTYLSLFHIFSSSFTLHLFIHLLFLLSFVVCLSFFSYLYMCFCSCIYLGRLIILYLIIYHAFLFVVFHYASVKGPVICHETILYHSWSSTWGCALRWSGPGANKKLTN